MRKFCRLSSISVINRLIPSGTRHNGSHGELPQGVPWGFRTHSLHNGPHRPRSIVFFAVKIGKANRFHHNRDTVQHYNKPGKVRRSKRHRSPIPGGVSRPEPGRELPAPDPKAENSCTCYNGLETKFDSLSQLIIEKLRDRFSAPLTLTDHLLTDEPELFAT